jgi:hypothetical protein
MTEATPTEFRWIENWMSRKLPPARPFGSLFAVAGQFRALDVVIAPFGGSGN